MTDILQPWNSDLYVAARLERFAKEWFIQASRSESDVNAASCIDASMCFEKCASIIRGQLQHEADREAEDQERSRESWHREAVWK